MAALALALALVLAGLAPAAAAVPGSPAVSRAIHCGLGAVSWHRPLPANVCPYLRSGVAGPKVELSSAGHRGMGSRRARHTGDGSAAANPGGGAGPSALPPAPAGAEFDEVEKRTHNSVAVRVTSTGLFPGSGLPEIEIQIGSASEPAPEPEHQPEAEQPKTEPEQPAPEPEAEPKPEPEPQPAPEPEIGEGEPESQPPDEAEPAWFAPNSVWNRELSATVPLAAQSSTYVAELVSQVESAGAWINTEEYSTPVYTVGPGQPRVAVEVVNQSGGWIAPALKSALSSVPLPPGAKPAAGTDEHLVVWQPSGNEMWEFWGLREEGGKWVTSYGGAMKDVSGSPGYYTSSSWPGAEPIWGATATSLPLVGGLMTIKQLESLKIEHALSMAIPYPGSDYVWPAQRGDGWVNSPGAIPEGTIFRLPKSVNLKSLELTALGLAIAEAAQKYGMVVRDTSSCVCLYGEASTTSGAKPYAQIFGGKMPSDLLANFPWTELVAIQPGN
ncbi:MAG TPA: hypothetical protein VH268_13570 [Solirubrobacterales bacterium]|nr:hypothetical protein [Solirubrobacterales bacterium]